MATVALIVVPSHRTGLSPLTRFVGLSLLKRAVLAAQRAGVATCLIWAEPTDPVLRAEVEGDRRVTSGLEWVCGSDAWVASPRISGQALVFGVDTVFSQSLVGLLARRSDGAGAIAVAAARGSVLALVPSSQIALIVDSLRHGAPLEASLHRAGNLLRVAVGPGQFLHRLACRSDLAGGERELLSSLENPRDGRLDRLLNRKLSRPLTRWLVKTPLSPNQITLLSAGIGLFAASCFLWADYWLSILGAVLLQVSIVLDCCDGEVARVRFEESSLGDWLDIACDTLVHIAVFVGIGFGVWQAGETSHAVELGVALVLGGMLAFPLVTLAEKTDVLGGRRAGWEDALIERALAALTTRDFSVIILGAALIGRLSWFLWGAAIGAQIFWLGLAWLLFRAGRFQALKRGWNRETD